MANLKGTDLLMVYIDGTHYSVPVSKIKDYIDLGLTYSNLELNPSGSYTFTRADGTTLNIDFDADEISFDNSTVSLNSVYVQDAIIELFSMIRSIKVVSTDANNSIISGSDGGAFFQEKITNMSYDSVSKVISYVNENGDVTNINLADLTSDIYVNGASLTDGVLTLVDNDSGNADVTIDLNALTGVLTNNNDGTYTYSTGSGNVIINTNKTASDIKYSNVTSGLTSTNVQGAVDELDARTDSLETSVASNDTDIANLQTAVSGITVVSADVDNSILAGSDGGSYFKETVTTFSYDNVGKILTYTNEDGTVVSANLSDLTTDIYVNGATLVDGVLTLVDNDSGTPDVTIDLNALTGTLVNNNDGTYTYSTGTGSVIINTNKVATDIAYSNANSGLTAVNVQEAIDELDERTDTLESNVASNDTDISALQTQLSNVKVVSDDADNSITAGSDNGAFFQETITNLTYNSVGKILSYTNEAGNIVNVSLSELTSDIYVNGASLTDGVLTLVDNETGNADITVDLNALTGTLTDNLDGTYTYTTGSGSVTINTNKTASQVSYVNTTSGLTATDVQGAVDEIDSRIDTLETNVASNDTDISNLQTAVNGIEVVSLDANNDITAGSDGGSFFQETVTTFGYDAATHILTYTNEEGTVVNANLADLVNDIYVNGASLTDGVLTLSDNDTETPDITIDLNALTGTLTDNGDGTYAYSTGAGTVVIDTNKTATDISYSNVTSGLSATTTQSAIDELDGRVDSAESTISGLQTQITSNDTDIANLQTAVSSNDTDIANLQTAVGDITVVSSDGGNDVTQGTDGGAFFQETATYMTYNASTKILSYTGEIGGTVNFNLADLATDIYVSGASLTDGVLTLVDNDNGTPDVTIDLNALTGTLTDNGDGSYTYSTGSGSVTFSTVGSTYTVATDANLYTKSFAVDATPTATWDDGKLSTELDATTGQVMLERDANGGIQSFYHELYQILDISNPVITLPTKQNLIVDIPQGNYDALNLAGGITLPSGNYIGQELTLTMYNGADNNDRYIRIDPTNINSSYSGESRRDVPNWDTLAYVIKKGRLIKFKWFGTYWKVAGGHAYENGVGRTLFVGKVPDGTVIPVGWNFLPMEVVYDPFNLWDANSNRYLFDNTYNVNSIIEYEFYAINTEGFFSSTAISDIRPSSNTLIQTSNFPLLPYAYLKWHAGIEDFSPLGAYTTSSGVYVYNASGGDLTLTGNAFTRGQWTLTITKKVGI